ncbi:MAG TPA: DUF6625 family protein [Chryseolinea sp.]|nr:DUF6625 family protein [Chryseolinea sp.]
MNSDQTKSKIALIVCYIGTLPWYFQYFVHTCRYNSTIDFYIITDDTVSLSLPDNVVIVPKSLQEINALASERLGFKTDIRTPYKLCDFKPTFGLLFSELIHDYDFWGYCDLDVVFGDIRSFITENILEKYDVISVRHDFLTGFFQVYRNVEKMRLLFMQSRDHQRVLESSIHSCFDETNFQFEAFAAGVREDKIHSDVDSMMHVVKRMESHGYLRAFFDFMIIEGIPGHIKWSNGKLVYRRKYEILLYHMIHFKKKYSRSKHVRSLAGGFTISTNRIYHLT